MTVFEFCEKYNLKPLSQGDDRDISGGFCGDLLSWVMANCQADNMWFTVMGNINSVAVASLNDIGAIVLCQDSRMMPDRLEKAKEEKINVFSTSASCFEIAGQLYDRLKG